MYKERGGEYSRRGRGYLTEIFILIGNREVVSRV